MQKQELVEIIAQRTSLSEGEIHHVVYSLRDVLLTAHRAGRAVKVEGLDLHARHPQRAASDCFPPKHGYAQAVEPDRKSAHQDPEQREPGHVRRRTGGVVEPGAPGRSGTGLNSTQPPAGKWV
jgi:nucleoid DNA-binding protein